MRILFRRKYAHLPLRLYTSHEDITVIHMTAHQFTWAMRTSLIWWQTNAHSIALNARIRKHNAHKPVYKKTAYVFNEHIIEHNRWMRTQQNNVLYINIQLYQLKRALHTEVCAHICWKYARTNAHKCAHWATANAHQALTKNALKHFMSGKCTENMRIPAFMLEKCTRNMRIQPISECANNKMYAQTTTLCQANAQEICACTWTLSAKYTRNMRIPAGALPGRIA